MSEFSLLAWCLTAFVLFLGCWLQTALGFGMAVIAAPIVILINPSWVPYVLTWIALVISATNAWNLRRNIHFKGMLPAFVMRLPGTALGAYALAHIAAVWLHVVVTLCVLIAVIISVVSIRFEATKNRLAVAGFASGFMGTTTSIGGPPMALVMQYSEPDTMRANLSLYFTYSCILSLASYFIGGLIDPHLTLVCLSFVPSALLGFWAGAKTRPMISLGLFRPLLLASCGIASLISLVGIVITFI
ncbi:sulfite exporter TauE/SafE family protein [Agarilytica rhodophyticola]|uniref:sulfite exporter TauE/SafE family protein n=1 Tax=Agarilytica rhodophyticola TaxID=1737490 RepID=UPI000B3415FB|nr:sulfite exporter TauE/SafE family protein [Agarilytica rhodophyticola]